MGRGDAARGARARHGRRPQGAPAGPARAAVRVRPRTARRDADRPQSRDADPGARRGHADRCGRCARRRWLMATITLSSLRDIIRFRGNYENSTKFTSARIDSEINAALAELHELMADTYEGYFDTSTTTPTVAAQEHVDLPATFWRLRGVDILISGKYRELTQIGFGERNHFQTSGRPQAYRTAAGGARGRLILYPTPNAVETIRINFVPTVTALSADGDTF